MVMIRVGHVAGKSNLLDIFTKILAKINRKKYLSNMLLGFIILIVFQGRSD